MNKEQLRPLLYPIADALAINLVFEGVKVNGSRKAVYDVFEGYSPTVIASVIDSLVDGINDIVAVTVQIWGNLNVMCILDNRQAMISLFVFDRAKIPTDLAPFGQFWSRQNTYSWLEGSCKAIYSRPIHDTEWVKLEAGPKKLKDYNEARYKGERAKVAYEAMWK